MKNKNVTKVVLFIFGLFVVPTSLFALAPTSKNQVNLDGRITSVSRNHFVMSTQTDKRKSDSYVLYTVDKTHAAVKFLKSPTSPSQKSIVVNDLVLVSGVLSGKNIKASTITDVGLGYAGSTTINLAPKNATSTKK